MTRVSVCMPVYNGAEWLAEQLDSILQQLGPEDEIVVNDDGSRDNSMQLLSSYQQRDPRVRILPARKFGNVVYNVEYLLQQARGSFILLSDQDDIWAPEKVTRMLAALSDHTLVVHDCAVVDAGKTLLHPSFYEMHGSGPGRFKNIVRNSYLGCCMGFRKELLQTALPFPEKLDMHDIWLGNIAAWWYELVFINDRLLSYRRHGGNASSASEASKYNRLQQIGMRLKLVAQLFKRYLR